MITLKDELRQLNEGLKSESLKSEFKTQQQALKQELSQLKSPQTPEITAPISKGEDKNWFQEFFKEEIGGVSNILAGMTSRTLTDLMTKDIQRQELYRTKFQESTGATKEKYRQLIYKELENPAYQDTFKAFLPEVEKTNSQVFGETLTLGLLVLPIPQLKALSSAKFLPRFLAGGTMGAAYGAALGLAGEGEIQEKVPEIALMTGIGFVGNGILTGTLPPIIKGTQTIYGKVKNIFDKANNGRFPIGTKTNVILPTVEEVVEKKILTSKIVPLKSDLLIETERKINSLDTIIYKKQQEIDNLLLGDVDFIASKTGIKTKPKIVDEKFIKSRAIELGQQQKALNKLVDKRTGLLNKSTLKNLKIGDTIGNPSLGSLKIQQFIPDDKGSVLIMASDSNNRLVTIMPDDIATLRKYTEKEITKKVFTGIEPVEELAIIRGKTTNITDAAKSVVIRASEQVKQLGSHGKQLVAVLDEALNQTRLYTGDKLEPFIQFIQKNKLHTKKFALNDNETKFIVDLLDEARTKKVIDINDLIEIKGLEQFGERSKLIQEFLQVFSDTTKEQVNTANTLGLKIRDSLTGKEYNIGQATSHFPHIPKDYQKFQENINDLIGLQAKRLGLSKSKAKQLVQDYFTQIKTNRYAGLEKSRTLRIEGYDELNKFGYETNPLVALEDFVEGSSRRIVEANLLGRGDEIIKELVVKMGEAGYDDRIPTKLWQRYRGENDTALGMKYAYSMAKDWQIISKLTLAAPINLTQNINQSIVYGIRRTLKHATKFIFSKTARKDMQMAGRLAGISDRTISAAVQMAGGDSSKASQYLQNVFFTPIERFNRYVSNAVGQDWAKVSLNKLVRNPDNPILIRKFEKLGIDIKQVIDRGGFADKELIEIGQKIVNQTQFRGSALDIPLSWSSDHGKFLTQFKSFSFQQGVFIKDSIGKEMLKGNLHPFIAYLVLNQFGGETINALRDTLKGDFEFRQDLNLLERFIDNNMTVGGVGIAGNLFEKMYQMAEGKFYVSTIDFVAGPTISEVTNLIDNTSQALGGNATPLQKQLLRNATVLTTLPGARNIVGLPIVVKVITDLVNNLVID